MNINKNQFKHGNISSIVYFNLERFNYPTDNRLVESITEYLYNRIDSMNDFNFDDFIVNYVSSMPKKEFEEKYYSNKLTLLTTWGDDVYYVN
tara:strand:+ start:371 stop:646 length:276 start_codon:yes stop_codon:yes gene_type:complete